MTENNIDDLVKSITTHAGVKGYIIVNHEGIPVRHSFEEADRPLTIQYAALMQQLAAMAKSAVKTLDASNDLTFLRLRSHKHEILVAPDRDYLLIVVQEPAAM
jgi:dynein light chain roadblock-type